MNDRDFAKCVLAALNCLNGEALDWDTDGFADMVFALERSSNYLGERRKRNMVAALIHIGECVNDRIPTVREAGLIRQITVAMRDQLRLMAEMAEEQKGDDDE
ncbi:MAG: hypothetical protein J6X53_04950 [Abditibacteriota bacterium]|nr:hypothetical protein [Abditibacteriota bacterium]